MASKDERTKAEKAKDAKSKSKATINVLGSRQDVIEKAISGSRKKKDS